MSSTAPAAPAAPPPAPAPSEWAVLAALRFGLASVVLFGHVAQLSGQTRGALAYALSHDCAVVGFLFVSGYSIAASLERRPAGFFERRASRILPSYLVAYALAVGVCAATGGSVTTPNGMAWQKEGEASALCTMVMLQGLVVETFAFIGPAWSLALEEWIYLLAPTLRRLHARWPAALVLLVLASAAVYFEHRRWAWSDPNASIGGRGLLMLLWAWLCGFLMYHHRGAWPRLLAIALGTALATQNYGHTYGATTVGVAAAVVGEARNIALPQGVARVASYLGDLSYPLYLVHWQIILLLAHAPPWTWAPVSIATAVLMLHLVDRPGRRMPLTRRSRRQ